MVTLGVAPNLLDTSLARLLYHRYSFAVLEFLRRYSSWIAALAFLSKVKLKLPGPAGVLVCFVGFNVELTYCLSEVVPSGTSPVPLVISGRIKSEVGASPLNARYPAGPSACGMVHLLSRVSAPVAYYNAGPGSSP